MAISQNFTRLTQSRFNISGKLLGFGEALEGKGGGKMLSADESEAFFA